MENEEMLNMRVDVMKYGLEYNKRELLKDRRGVCVIRYGYYPYDTFNFCFVNDILSQILQVLYAGYIPYIDLAGRNPGDNNWSMWFEQPFEKEINFAEYETIRPEGRIKTCWIPGYESPYVDYEKDLACKLYLDWLVFNDDVMNYIAEEYKDIIKANRSSGIMGCLCRGTDFTTVKPLGHPVQPSVEEVMDEAEQKMMDLSLEMIYLATEEERIRDMFEERFPGCILTNSRNYLDKMYYDAIKKSDKKALEIIKDEDPDNRFRQGLSYLSSIVLLSSCDALVAGNCGGSDAALFFNDNSYKYVNLFQLGRY